MSKQVKAWVLKEAGKLELLNYDYPELKKDSIIVKVEAAGVCGTDKHMYLGRAAKYPIIPGHEVAGIVEEIGEEAQEKIVIIGTDKLKKGDRVVVTPGSKVCGKCYFCTHVPNKPNLCSNRFVYGVSSCDEPPHLFGGFAEYMYIKPNSWLFKIPDNLSSEIASLTEPVSVALKAVERAIQPGEPYTGNGLGIGRSTLVIGAGPIGILATAILKYIGAGKIIVSDLVESRLSMAKDLGADFTINAKASFEECKNKILELTDGVGPDVVIEAAGVPKAFEEGLELVRRGGIMVEVGHYTDTGIAQLHPHTVCKKEVDIRGAWAYPQITFKDALSFLSRTDLPINKVITHEFDLSKVEEAINMLGKEGVSKIVIKP